MSIETYFYNHYNIKGTYTPQIPEIPDWKKRYAIVKDEISSNNNSQNNSEYKAYSKLEETYYKLSVANRQKYHTRDEVITALSKKYSAQSAVYGRYNNTERDAMYQNELYMTLYGCLGGGGNVDDPHVDGDVYDPTESERKSYNRKMVNRQVNTVLLNTGIDLIRLDDYDITFTIDPVCFLLKVTGVEDEELKNQIEGALNTGENAKQLFYHILYNSGSSISEEVLTKYLAMKEFQNVTGLKLNDFIQTKVGFENVDGENALDLYKKYLKTSDSVIPGHKNGIYDYFKGLLNQLSTKNYAEIQDLNLSIRYKNGILYDISDSDIQTSKFDISV